MRVTSFTVPRACEQAVNVTGDLRFFFARKDADAYGTCSIANGSEILLIRLFIEPKSKDCEPIADGSSDGGVVFADSPREDQQV